MTEPTTPTTPTQFRKRPVAIEAMQIRDGNEPIPSTGPLTPNEFDVACVSGWMLARGFRGFKVHGDHPFGIAIETLEGVMVASPGDWIIRGVLGEFYPCKSDIFEATYERVADDERSDLPGELDALPLADLLDPDSAATKLELRHALGLAWAEVLRLREAEARVRALHFEDPFVNGSCNECDAWLPCGTILALNEGRP